MAHLHDIIDTDKRFYINPVTRVIKNETGKVNLIQYDHNAERFGFEVPRFVEGHDMTLCDRIEIHYINLASATEKSEDLYLVDDIQVSPSSNDTAIFTWLVSANATKYAGTLNFLIRFVCLDGETVTYAWNTAIFKSINVGAGMDNVAAAIELSTDVLEAWRNEVLGGTEAAAHRAEEAATRAEEAAAKAEAGGGGGTVEVDTTLTQSGKAADAKATGDRLSNVEKQLADMNYKAITASLSVNVTTKEMGSSVTGAVLSWSVSKETKSITLDGVAVDGKTSYTDPNTYTSNKTWTLKATEKNGKSDGTCATATATASLSFLNGVYYGVSSNGSIDTEDSAEIQAFTKSLRSSKLTSFNVNAGAGQYIYYCLPKRMGACVFTVGVLSGGFTLQSEGNFTNASGYTETYYVYRSNNAGLGAQTVKVS